MIHKMAEDPTPSDNPEGEDRPEWLPANFDAPEALVDSYKEAQRKITEEATARRNLEQLVAQQQAQIEQIQAAQQPAQQEDPSEWYTAFEQDPIATQRALAEQAARDEVAKYVQQNQPYMQATQGSQAEIVNDLALRQLEAEYGTLTPELRQQMTEVITAKPYLVPQEALYSPQKLAEAYRDVLKIVSPNTAPQVSQEELQRTMKLQAQSASGAGGRLDPADYQETRWQEIATASTGKLGL